jgi:hypothetical protein
VTTRRKSDTERLDRFRAWLVTGAPGRGIAFALDFAAAARTMLKARRGEARKIR